MISAYNREVETEKEYNGRQLLELLQNADDEKSDEVLIELNTEQNRLTISNRGTACSSFSYEGILSLMISNLSSKTTKKFIGNKGLGFRSIINWSERITINSDNLDIIFAREIVDNVFDELFDIETQEQIRKERNLPKSINPIPFLSIPTITEKQQTDWTTSVSIQYKSTYLQDIQKQINELKNEILLFLNSIQKLVVVVDNETLLEVEKESLFQKWTIFQKSEKLPKTLWDKENEEEYFDLKIAMQDSLKNDIKELFSYFPTKIDINLPFIVHGTFELNSSRNEVNDSPKNRYILEKLVELIVSTAKDITKEEVSYKALEILSYTTQNNILKELGFYEVIANAIEKLEVFPCLDGKYRAMDEVIFIDELSVFAQRTHNESLFKNLLIPINNHINLDSHSLGTSIDTEKLSELSKNIDSIDDRADLIYMFFTLKLEEKLPFLIDKDKNLIAVDDDVYTPSKNDFSIPKFVKIKFIHKDLFDKLILKFNIVSNEKSRDLQRKLKEITNIQSYEPAPVLQKIVTSTNKELEKENSDHMKIIKEMVQSLYENYILLDKTKIPSDTKIQLLNESKLISDAKDLFLSKSYPSGELTELLFSDVFTSEEFLADVTIYGFHNEELEDIEEFFLWLGVNKISKLVPASQNDTSIYSRIFFTSIKGKPDYADHMSLNSAKKIYNLDTIYKHISLENFIIWCIKDKHIQESFDGKESVDIRGSRGGYINSRYCDTSYIYYQLFSLNMFKDYLIGNDKLSPLINNVSFDFNYKEFETYKINKSDIESTLLKVGAIDKFEKLSIEAVNRIVKELPNNASEGRQTQSIYKLCIKHYEHNKMPLKSGENTMLFAKRGEEKKYFKLQDVFYNGNIKLPKKITSSKAVLDYPRRQNTKNVISFFGINNLSSISIDISNKEVSNSLTKEFNLSIEQIKEYILVYRIKDIEADRTADAELRKLQSLNILLCNSVQYKIDDENFELENNDYIKGGNYYLIKINSDQSLNDIKNTFEFQESFADIIGLVFDIQDTKVFRDMVKEDTTYIEKTVRNDIGSDELVRARELLGKTDELFSFWQTVYTLIDKEYTFTSDKYLFDLIKKDLDLSIPIENIDYKNLAIYESCLYIEHILNIFEISIETFNQSDSFYKIDFSEFHRLNIQQAFDSYSMTFQRKLYTYCIEKNKEKEFNTLKAIYNKNESYSIEQVDNNKFNTNVDYNSIVQQYISDFFEISACEPTVIDFKSIFDKNVSKIDFNKLDGKTEYISLLYFNGTLDTIREYINSTVRIEEEEPELGKTKIIANPKPIVDIDLTDITISQAQRPQTKKPYKHSSKSDSNKQSKGKKSEQDVYDSLVLEYGNENVEQVSNDDDSLGYDIKYKNKDGVYKYVEVKSFSGGQFYLTKNEKEFSKKYLGFYELFLVGDNIFRIQYVDYDDNTQFNLISSEFIVRYNYK